MVGGTNPSILEINFAEHLKKHEITGDSQDVGRLQRTVKILSSTPVTTILILVGFVSGNWLVENLYKIAFPWFYVDFPIALFALSAIVWYLFRPHIKFYGYLLLISVSWLTSIMIGRIVSGFWEAITGLLPFYQNPFVIAYWVDYFAIFACLVYAQNGIGKLLNQWHHKSNYSRR